MGLGANINDDYWGCPVCGEHIGYGDMHEHPFVPYLERADPPRLPLRRRCHSCNATDFIWKMGYVRKSARRARSYWLCLPCYVGMSEEGLEPRI
ncbi:MAG TPA: hypothetical protein VHV50_04315 [Actinomycetota bacterium]|jgi:hypothetical protein|nr:hypothetical protein [Actinomycetota bacterium]